MTTTNEMSTLAAEAYIYGYPLVVNLEKYLQPLLPGSSPGTPPLNTFNHATSLAGPEAKFVAINNDTIYSIALLDLSGGPLVLHVPDTSGAYYVLQFVDAWTNNFAYIGRRATGTSEGEFLIAPPGWTGETPAEMRCITSPTLAAAIVGRNAVNGEADLPRVRTLQAGFTLRPLDAAQSAVGISKPDSRVQSDLVFWEQFRTWMQAFPPAPVEHTYQQRFAPLGLLDSESPYINVDPALATALQTGAEKARGQLDQLAGFGTPVNGWSSALHAFDYNNDYFEIGALDDVRWRIADPARAHITRAAAARAGLWGNHGYEAVYASADVDGSGEQLHGGNSYRIHFGSLPPVDAFWSITMYEPPEYFLVANPIGRYSIGDRTPGLRRDADGSLNLLVQHADPGEAEHGNWLPAPVGNFRLLMRMYQPGDAILNGSYALPPVERMR
jgi:hypothetical protein